MRKLYKLKEWYSLEDTASRLTITLGEPVTVKDVLQLCLESHLTLSWYMRHVPAQEVAPVTRIINMDEINRKMAEKVGKPFKTEGTFYSEGYQEQSHLITHLDGAHKLELELCGAMKDWVLSLITNTGGELISWEGYFVTDKMGRIWRIMESFGSVYLKERREKLSPEMLEDDRDKPINHSDYYFPSGGCPDEEDLGITKADLEAFEKELMASKPSQIDKALHPKERESLLKLVIGMAIDGYGYKPKDSRSPIAGEVSSALLTHGISVDEDTVRKWLTQAKEYYTPEMSDAL